MAERIYRMDKFDITTPIHFPPVFNLYGLLLLLCLSILTFLSQPKRQRILPGVPIVGVGEAVKVSEARTRFRHGSKDILLEGYQKVKSVHRFILFCD